MKKAIAAKLTVFLLGMVWILLYLYVCIVGYDFFEDFLTAYSDITESWFRTVLEVWYLVTTVIVGVIITKLSFSYVGTWERKGEKLVD